MSGPGDLDDRWRAVMEAYQANRSATAVVRAEALLEEDPDFGAAWIVLGAALGDLSRYEEARRALKKALSLSPPEMQKIVLSNLGHLYDAKGDPKRAAEWYRKAIEADPGDAGPRLHLGSVLRMQGKLEEAEAELREALDCEQGERDQIWLLLGLVLRSRGAFEEARKCLAEALGIDPDDGSARDALVDVETARKALEDGG